MKRDDKQKKRPKVSAEEANERTGIYTSGIVSTREDRRIALFFTGRNHAGENLDKVLRERASVLAPAIQMCDGLPQNLPAELKTIVANCIAHARRNFVDLAEIFPAECRYVLKRLGKVYKNDAIARNEGMSEEARLSFHQAESAAVMDELNDWLTKQFDEKKVEPNSSLGEAINYMLKRWEKLTLFLRELGAPLDNSTCERALK